MRNPLIALLRDEEGASLVEYSLIVALVAIVAVTGLQLVGSAANSTLSTAASSVSG